MLPLSTPQFLSLILLTQTLPTTLSLQIPLQNQNPQSPLNKHTPRSSDKDPVLQTYASEEEKNLYKNETPLLHLHRRLVEIESVTPNEIPVGEYLVNYLLSQNLTVEKQYIPSNFDSNSGSDIESDIEEETCIITLRNYGSEVETGKGCDEIASTTTEPRRNEDKKRRRFNIYAYKGLERNTKAVLTSHMDTVPPFLPYRIVQPSHHNSSSDALPEASSKPYTYNPSTRLYGRGTNDAKGSIATQIFAFLSLLNNNTTPSTSALSTQSLSLLFVTGEERDGSGMLTASKHLHINPSYMIFGEPTEGKLASGHKGVMFLTLKVLGRSAHSGYPWLGVSANDILVKALEAIRSLGDVSTNDEKGGGLPRSEKYGNTTLNIGQMTGGVAANVVSERAEATIALRLAASSPQRVYNQIWNLIKNTTHDLADPAETNNLTTNDLITNGIITNEETTHTPPKGKISLSLSKNGYPPIDIDHDIPYFSEKKNGIITVNYGTDVPNWTKKGCKRYLYGPGSILVAHSDHEFVRVGELESGVEDYKRIVLEVLGR